MLADPAESVPVWTSNLQDPIPGTRLDFANLLFGTGLLGDSGSMELRRNAMHFFQRSCSATLLCTVVLHTRRKKLLLRLVKLLLKKAQRSCFANMPSVHETCNDDAFGGYSVPVDIILPVRRSLTIRLSTIRRDRSVYRFYVGTYKLQWFIDNFRKNSSRLNGGVYSYLKRD